MTGKNGQVERWKSENDTKKLVWANIIRFKTHHYFVRQKKYPVKILTKNHSLISKCIFRTIPWLFLAVILTIYPALQLAVKFAHSSRQLPFAVPGVKQER